MTRLLFTCGLLTTLGLAATAQAERVVLLTPTGTAGQEELDRVEEALVDAVFALGHEAVTESGAASVPADAPPPETANEMRAVAEMQNAQYVVVPHITALPGQYRLLLRVGYAPGPRVEEIEVHVLRANEAERLRDVLGALLRPEGLGEDAVRLTQPVEEPPVEEPPVEEPPVEEEDADAAAEEEDADAAAEEEERARQEFLERERRRTEEERRRREEAWEARERYGEHGGPWLAQLGVDLRTIAAHQEVIVDGEDVGGGALGGLSLRLGRRIPGVSGLELRAALELTTGASSGFGIAAGGVYLYSVSENVPVFIGGSIEAGMFQFTTGNRVPSFVTRISSVAAWRPTDSLFLEAALPEFVFLSANGGVATLGLSVRAGLRF